MGTSNFYRRSFRQDRPTEIVSREALERMKVDDLKYVGPTGERDEAGLAKRVALYLDRNKKIDDRDTVKIYQEGSTIIVTSQNSWDDAVFVVKQIEEEIDNSTDIINAHLLLGAGHMRIDKTPDGHPRNPPSPSPSPTPKN